LTVGGGVEGVKLCTLMFFSLPWLQLLLCESSESDIIEARADLFFFWKFSEVPTI